MIVSSVKFDKDYYEDGVKKGISCYENYRYMPTRSYEEAITIVEECLGKKKDKVTVLDLGCAKGYLVHALRQLGVSAYGEDISEYALDNCHPNVEGCVSFPSCHKYDFVICKDVLEHQTEEDILPFLKQIKDRCKFALFVIPLGDNDKYRIPEYEKDVTHLIKKDEDWWINKLSEAGFELLHFDYKLGNIKKKWIKQNPHGNAFFEVKSV